MTTRLQAIAEAASALKDALNLVPGGQFKERAVFVAHEELADALAAPAGMDADEVNGILLRVLGFVKQDAERCQAIAKALVAETQDSRAKEILERASNIVGRAYTWERLSGRPASALAVEVDQLGLSLAMTTREHIALKEQHARLIDNCNTQGAAVRKQADKIAELEEALNDAQTEALIRHAEQLKAERESARRGGEIEQLRQRLEGERTAHAGANVLLETKERLLLAAEKAQEEALAAKDKAAAEHCRGALDTVLAEYGNVLMGVRSALRAFYEGAQSGDRFFAMPQAAVGEFERAKRILDLALGIGHVSEETLREAEKATKGKEIGDLQKRHEEKDARIAVMDARIGKLEERLAERNAEVLDLDQMLRKEREKSGKRGEALGTAAETLKRGQFFIVKDAWRNVPEDLRIWAASLVTEFNSAIDACESLLTAQAPESITQGKSFAISGTWSVMPEELRAWAARLAAEFGAMIWTCELSFGEPAPSPETAGEPPALFDTAK